MVVRLNSLAVEDVIGFSGQAGLQQRRLEDGLLVYAQVIQHFLVSRQCNTEIENNNFCLLLGYVVFSFKSFS